MAGAEAGAARAAPVRSVAILGGTHGNELAGVELCRRWCAEGLPQGSGQGGASPFAGEVVRDSFDTAVVLSNPRAVAECCRFITQDLNRCFPSADGSITGGAGAPPAAPSSPATAGSAAAAAPDPTGGGDGLSHLRADDGGSYELRRAAELRGRLGGTDLIVDLHNTTSCSEVMLITSDTADVLSLQLCASVARAMAGHCAEAGWPIQGRCTVFVPVPESATSRLLANIGSIAPHDVGVEIGPVAHGTCKAWTVECARRVVGEILDFVHGFNTADAPLPATELEIYRLHRPLYYPQRAGGDGAGPGPGVSAGLRGLIHPSLQDRDYGPLRPGAPLFQCVDGSVVAYSEADHASDSAEGRYDVCPLFVNEAAYLGKGLACWLTRREVISVPALCCAD